MPSAGPGQATPHSRTVRPEDIRTGDMLIVPTKYGGCDEFGWAPATISNVEDISPVEDAAADAAKPFWGRRCAARIVPGIVETGCPMGAASGRFRGRGHQRLRISATVA